MGKLRVLHLGAGNLYGGVEKVLTTLASQRHLCPEMDPSFGLCFEGRLADELRASGVAVHLLGNVRLSRPWTVWRARRRLSVLLNAQPKFDVAIVHSCWVHAAFAPAVPRARTSLWFWAHDAYLQLHKIDRAAARTKPDHVIANSQFTLGTVPLLFGQVPAEVLYLPLPPPPPMDRELVRSKVRLSLKCPLEATVIFMAARLEPWKGHTLLLEALAKIKRCNWRAWIAGGPQRPHEEKYYQQLQSIARRLGIEERIQWLGQRNDMPDLLAAADIHCQPNLGPEPFGIAFIEAMQAGLPVVTTRLGAAPEIIEPDCGVLTKPGNALSLAETLSKMMETESRCVLTGGPARAKSLCDPTQQLKRLSAILR